MREVSLKKIAIVEDDPILTRALSLAIQSAGYAVEFYNSIRGFNTKANTSSLDLLILDVGLPDGDGIETLKSLRENGFKSPVILLTAKDHEDSVVAGLTAGASDYIKKPYSNKELVARIKTALRESTFTEKKIRIGEITIHVDKRQVFFGDAVLVLNRRQFDILLYLSERQGMVVSRDALIQSIKRDGEMFDRTVDSHISHLRTILRKYQVTSISIASVYGVGYRLEAIERVKNED
jgi:DNA-binding response OmpR family regulator